MKYHNITHDDMLNGDGIRVVLWVSGCEHHCPECQNPVTWNPDDGKEFTFDEFEEIRKELEKPYVSGITFSGGDPLHPENRENIQSLVEAVKKMFPDKTMWMYTGYCWEDVLENQDMMKIIGFIDVLVDGKFDKQLADKNFHWAGSTNQRVIDVQESLQKGKVVLHECN